MSVKGAVGSLIGPSRELGRESGKGVAKELAIGELYPELGAEEFEYAEPDSQSLIPLLPTDMTEPIQIKFRDTNEKELC